MILICYVCSQGFWSVSLRRADMRKFRRASKCHLAVMARICATKRCQTKSFCTNNVTIAKNTPTNFELKPLQPKLDITGKPENPVHRLTDSNRAQLRRPRRPSKYIVNVRCVREYKEATRIDTSSFFYFIWLSWSVSRWDLLPVCWLSSWHWIVSFTFKI